MAQFVAGRLLASIPVLWGVATIVFVLMRILPGDPAKLMLYETGASAEDIENLRHQLGLDQPIYVQYWDYLSNIARGDFGKSFYTKEQVTSMLGAQLSSTIELTFASMIVSTFVGVTLGVLSAIRQHSWLDAISMMFALAGVSLPSFW